MNNRRKLLIALGAGALAAPFGSFSQQQGKVWRIGFLGVSSRQAQGAYLDTMIEALATYGWIDGTNFTLVERWANGNYEQLPLLAEELAGKSPALIIAAPSRAVAAMAKAAPATPIIVASGDPLAAGLVTNLAHPGGMITGVTNIVAQVNVKLLELLMDAVPTLRRVGFLGDPNNPPHTSLIDAQRYAAKKHSVQGLFADAASAEMIEDAISRLTKDGAQALVVEPGPLLTSHTKRIVNLAADRRWPSISGISYFAEAGGMLAYGADRPALWRRVAWYVDQILKGKKPGDLPIEQPTKFEMLVNMKTAKALGIKIPNSILLRADKVIE